MPWTEKQITDLLDTNDRAVERAIVAIYERQTADEKQAEHTRHDNTVGFRQNHAKRMSYYARLIKMGKHLYPSQLALSRGWMKMYRRQLADIANKKEAAAFKPATLTADAAARIAQINAEEDAREHRKASFAGADDDAPPSGEPIPREPPVGSWASIARMLVADGSMTGDEADRWKDEMKEQDLG